VEVIPFERPAGKVDAAELPPDVVEGEMAWRRVYVGATSARGSP